MSNIITARALYIPETVFTLCDKEVSLNSNKFVGDTPKFGWLNRIASPIGGDDGIAYALTFANPNADALKGVWIEEEGGVGVLIDADPTTGVADVITAADACCGNSTAVAPHYAGTYPALTLNTIHTGTIVRADDGSYLAKQKLILDDYGKRVLTISFTSRSGGNSTYGYTAYAIPAAVKFNGVLDTVT
jgi:hypothetical protein